MGRLAVGRIFNGTIKKGDQVSIMEAEKDTRLAKVNSLYLFSGLERIESEEAKAGDIIALSGMEGVNIGDTISSAEEPKGARRYKARRADDLYDDLSQHLAIRR